MEPDAVFRYAAAVPGATPTVSVVTATYHRTDALACAIRSVLAQTGADWEQWVMGDACTDNTGEVVAAFADPRIRFHNLPVNCGEQSGPNNEGVRRARGKYLAFLNHDDLWFPDHLETAIGALEETKADLVFPLMSSMHPDGTNHVLGIHPDAHYEPGLFVPASGWVMRRELMDRVGAWRSARECHLVPSQDWLFRAWKSGARIRVNKHLTVLTFATVMRPGSYVRGTGGELERCLQWMSGDARLRERLLVEHALSRAGEPLKWHAPSALIGQALKTLLRRFVVALGVHPGTIREWASFRRKGAEIDRLREVRGLPVKGRETKES